MSTFVNNDVSSGAVVFAADHNTQGALLAAVLNGGIDHNNISPTAAITGSQLATGTLTDTQLDASISPLTRGAETYFDYVASGCVWTADAAGSTRLASMTAGVVYIAGKRVSVAAVTSRTFTASKDVYVDVDNTGTITYADGTTNAASGALAANSIRLAIIVVGASSIATAAAINQGQEDRVLPIASSIPYAVTDSLGNLICPRDPNRRTLGYRQIISTFTSTATPALTDVTGLSAPVIVPTGRKVKVTAYCGYLKSTTAGAGQSLNWAVVEDSTVINSSVFAIDTVGFGRLAISEQGSSPSAGSHTYKAQAAQSAAGTLTVTANSVGSAGLNPGPAWIRVELA